MSGIFYKCIHVIKMYQQIYLLFLLIFYANFSYAYKPVVLLHGIMTGNESMVLIEDRVKEVS